MASAEFYRREAERCRASALATDARDARERWRRMARDYDTLAQALAADAKESASLLMRAPLQRQEAQQQQAKAAPEKS